ncbi:MAG: hypothetical protein AB7Q81_21985 [Gammaproteobacteria bacterium]
MTTIERLCVALLLFLAVCGMASAADEQASGDDVFSEAETRMWMTDQLSSVPGPIALTYSFEKSGSFEAGFNDHVRLVIDKVNDDGSKSVSIEFFTGERHWPTPPVPSTHVNLVLSKYLEGDVYEMRRLTDPQNSAQERWRYFMRRIKLALAESAAVEPRTVTFEGHDYQAHEIRFEPYSDDPHRNEFEQFADKVYSVIVADELPGYVYRIETLVPGAGDGAEPLIREVLELKSIEPLPAAPSS